jgi:WD40 repeat protein
MERILSGGIWDLDFSPDGKQLVTIDTNNAVHIWNTANGQLLKEWEDYLGLAQTVIFHPSEPYILVLADEVVYRWNYL